MNKLLAILTQELPPNLYHFSEDIPLENLTSLCQQHDFQLYYINGNQIQNKSDFLAVCTEVMKLPEFFGYNWDAFEDCLTDFLYTQETKYLFFYAHSESFAKNDAKQWKIMLDIFHSSIEMLIENNTFLYVILHQG